MCPSPWRVADRRTLTLSGRAERMRARDRSSAMLDPTPLTISSSLGGSRIRRCWGDRGPSAELSYRLSGPLAQAPSRADPPARPHRSLYSSRARSRHRGSVETGFRSRHSCLLECATGAGVAIVPQNRDAPSSREHLADDLNLFVAKLSDLIGQPGRVASGPGEAGDQTGTDAADRRRQATVRAVAPGWRARPLWRSSPGERACWRRAPR